MKNKVLILLLVICSSLMLFGCEKKNDDAINFKEEYEKMNDKTNSGGVSYRSVKIEEDNPFVYISAEDLIKKFENSETFYVYFGDTLCPWCRSVIEKAIEVADENDIETIYYVKIWDDEHNEILRDKYSLNKDGKPELINNGAKEYSKLLEYLDNVLSDYTLTDDKGNSVSVGEKRIFAPNFIYVQNGVAKKLVDGISEKQKKPNDELTKEVLNDEEAQFKEFFSN